MCVRPHAGRGTAGARPALARPAGSPLRRGARRSLRRRRAVASRTGARAGLGTGRRPRSPCEQAGERRAGAAAAARGRDEHRVAERLPRRQRPAGGCRRGLRLCALPRDPQRDGLRPAARLRGDRLDRARLPRRLARPPQTGRGAVGAPRRARPARRQRRGGSWLRRGDLKADEPHARSADRRVRAGAERDARRRGSPGRTEETVGPRRLARAVRRSSARSSRPTSSASRSAASCASRPSTRASSARRPRRRRR